MRLLLDADVLIGALDADDPHHAQARELFAGWRDQQATALISVVNLTEVLIAPAGEAAKLAAARAHRAGRFGPSAHSGDRRGGRPVAPAPSDQPA